MKRIIIITDSGRQQISGVATALSHRKEILEKKGFEVLMIHPDFFTTIPLPIYPECKMAIFSSKKLEEMIKEFEPDYIHIETEGALCASARSLCVKNGWAFTTSYHTRIPEYIALKSSILEKVSRKYMRWMHSKSRRIMVTTQSLKKELEALHFKNVTLVSLGVDTNLFKRNPFATPPKGLKKPIFTFLGRVSPEKSVDMFLACDLPGSKLVIGDGAEKKKLQKEFKNKALFVGYKKGQELINLLSVSDVFVFPSKTETFGLVMIEALACGLPVAAYNVHGPKDIITSGFDGFLGENLKKNALKCLKLKPENCRKTAMKYSWKESAEKFIKNLVPIDAP